MKTNWQQTPQLKDSILPDWKDSDFAKTTHGQIMILINEAVVGKHVIEAQALSWSVIEQILLPKLIGWIIKILKISLPKDIDKLNIKNINLLYFAISHDEQLYKKLEEGRKKRNKMVHTIATLVSIKVVKKFAKESLILNIALQEEIMKRFSGEVQIPSINLYKNGWNDCVRKSKENIEKLS